MSSIIAALKDKDDKKAFEKTKEIAAESEFSSKYYTYLEEFAVLLTNPKSYIRVRAFILCCSQAKWDKDGKLQKILPQLFQLLHDDKPTVVRQCLNAIQEIAVYRPELCGNIKDELAKIDLSKYKSNMAALIQKDINNLLEVFPAL